MLQAPRAAGSAAFQSPQSIALAAGLHGGVQHVMQGGMLSGLPGGLQGGQQGGSQGLGGVGGRELQEQAAQMEEMEQLSRREEQGLQEQLPQVARASNSIVVVDTYKSEMSR